MKIESNHIKANGSELSVIPINGSFFSPKEIQDVVGGNVTFIKLPNDYVLAVNEDGISKGFSFNKKASKIAGIKIVGDVLHTHLKLLK